jgi:hypothetical protein
MGHWRAMGEVMRNGLSLWRWNRWFRVRFIRRWQMRGFWPRPRDLDRMTREELEAFFRSVGLDESIDAALQEIEAERDQNLVVASVSAEEARAQRLGPKGA